MSGFDEWGEVLKEALLQGDSLKKQYARKVMTDMNTIDGIPPHGIGMERR